MRIIIIFLTFISLNIYSQRQTKIFWDASLSMIDRNFNKEEGFLNGYFDKVKDVEVTVVKFNYKIIDKKQFLVKHSDWSEIREYLMNTKYDGATAYNVMTNEDVNKDIFIFSDGRESMYFEAPKLSGNLYVINSCKNHDKQKLKYLTLANSGKLINFEENFGDYDDASNSKIYHGKIYTDDTSIRKIQVRVKGKKEITVDLVSNKSYEIEAHEGDTLIFSLDKQKDVEKVLSANQNLNVWLEDGNVRLEEIVVNASVDNLVDQKITTAYGDQDKVGLGYQVQSVEGDELSDIVTDVSTAFRGKFASVNYKASEDISRAIIRGQNSILLNNYALIVVDGIPITSSSSSTFSPSLQSTSYLDPNNIADVTVLNGLAATNRFGSRGSNGVILITTKVAAMAKNGGKPKDLALVKDNVYAGNIEPSKKEIDEPYLLLLKKERSVMSAYKSYLEQRELFWDNPSYYIDLFDFFKSSNKELAYQIISNVLETGPPSINQLRALKIKAVSDNNYELAMEIALRTLELFPFKAQSYFDLAHAYRGLGKYQEALDILNKMADGTVNPEIDFKGISKIVDTEIKNLIYNHKENLDLYRTDVKYLKNIENNVRLFFEWNNEDAQFSLQFVNPQKLFFNWEHSLEKNRDRIRQEVEDGFSMEQFEIFDDGIGEWIINVKSISNTNPKDNQPTFLNCTVYYNYGKPNQTYEQFTARLKGNGHSEQLVKFKVK